MMFRRVQVTRRETLNLSPRWAFFAETGCFNSLTSSMDQSPLVRLTTLKGEFHINVLYNRKRRHLALGYIGAHDYKQTLLN